jgi:hypothetical protein
MSAHFHAVEEEQRGTNEGTNRQTGWFRLDFGSPSRFFLSLSVCAASHSLVV